MTADPLLERESELARGETRFIRLTQKKDLVSCCEQDFYLVVEIPELRPALRGRLAWLLEEAVERALELRGACPPGIGAAADLEISLRDQLYRARLLGTPGFAIFIPSLEGITSRRGALDADDSAALRFWVESTRICPLRLYLDVNDCMLGVYLEPITLAQVVNGDSAPAKSAGPPVVVEWFEGKGRSSGKNAQTPAQHRIKRCEADPEVEPESPTTLGRKPAITAESNGESFAACSPPQPEPSNDQPIPSAVVYSVPAPHPESEPIEEVPAEPPTHAPVDAVAATWSEPAPHPEMEIPETAHRDAESAPMQQDAVPDEQSNDDAESFAALEDPESAEVQLPEEVPQDTHSDSLPVLPSDEEAQQSIANTLPTPAPELEAEPYPPVQVAVEPEHESAAERSNVIATSEPAPHPETEPEKYVFSAGDPKRPLNPDAGIAWRHWMQKLDAARGPKPLNAIEQLFMTAYVPLSDACHRGIAGAEARPVLDSWSSSFARSYAEAFDAMRLRGRRPMMVLDIPEAAQRLARLHGARNVQLVLVDAMRFDVGLRVEQHLVAALGQRATLTDRFLLWSALPTTTAQQLELIGRGADGLKDGDVLTETPVLVARGRQAATPRRIRAGSRELLKLDLVEARLGEAGGPLAARLDQLAVEVSESLCAAFERMAPRTLVAVFGDHGFCLDPTDTGSTNLRQGGASPDEVLVPGFAWLVGPTH